jgi:hypothetical protein
MTLSSRRVWITRDGILCAFGLAGIVHETAIATQPREALLVLFGGMIGLPAVLHKDERNQAEEDAPDKPVGS